MSFSFSSESLDFLRESVGQRISEKRYLHTLAVEDMTVRMTEIYCPENIPLMRAAALLHDITKEYSGEEHLKTLRECGIILSNEEMAAPKTWHARTAAAILPKEFPQFASPLVVSAVRWHTTGHAGMTLTEKILYLADYIDMTRLYDDCIALRKAFWEAEPQKMEKEERENHLNEIIVQSLDTTIQHLLKNRRVVSSDTFQARNDCLLQIGTYRKQHEKQENNSQ